MVCFRCILVIMVIALVICFINVLFQWNIVMDILEIFEQPTMESVNKVNDHGASAVAFITGISNMINYHNVKYELLSIKLSVKMFTDSPHTDLIHRLFLKHCYNAEKYGTQNWFFICIFLECFFSRTSELIAINCPGWQPIAVHRWSPMIHRSPTGGHRKYMNMFAQDVNKMSL